MVYDWFNRSAAPQNPQDSQPEQAAEPPVQDKAPAVSTPAAAEPAQGSSDIDQDALDWARQAYARLKAQQEAQKQEAAAAAEPEPEPAPPAEPEPVSAPVSVRSNSSRSPVAVTVNVT